MLSGLLELVFPLAVRTCINRLLPVQNWGLILGATGGRTYGTRLFSPEPWRGRMMPGLCYLGRKRGVLLRQLPPEFAYDYDRLAYFLQCLPTWLRTAIKFRHHSWHCELICVAEAEKPKEYSKSYKCADYKPKYEVQAVKTLSVVSRAA